MVSSHQDNKTSRSIFQAQDTTITVVMYDSSGLWRSLMHMHTGFVYEYNISDNAILGTEILCSHYTQMEVIDVFDKR